MAIISENLQILKDSTDAIKQTIIDKGGTINGDITTWASAIDSLPNEGISTKYNIDFNATTENNVNVYNFLIGLLSLITCNGKEINSCRILSGPGSVIVFLSNENSAYNITLNSGGECFSTTNGGSDN